MRCLLLLMVSFTSVFAQDLTAPFAHNKHASLKLKCTACHANALTKERAGFPQVAACRNCHPALADRKIPSSRTFQIPDFVFFNHAPHAAKASCETCHGPVYSSTLAKPVGTMKMPACMACHKENNATLVCNACHELGQ